MNFDVLTYFPPQYVSNMLISSLFMRPSISRDFSPSTTCATDFMFG